MSSLAACQRWSMIGVAVAAAWSWQLQAALVCYAVVWCMHRALLPNASKMEALVGSQLKKVPPSKIYGSRRTVFFGEASSKSRGRSDDSYTVRYSFRGRLHGISMISS